VRVSCRGSVDNSGGRVSLLVVVLLLISDYGG
jgi:hypothetical protein